MAGADEAIKQDEMAGRQAQTKGAARQEIPMIDLIVFAGFWAMVLCPCVVALRTPLEQ